MNDENLIPLNERTTSERREIARQGGIASGCSRQRRKKLREQLTYLLGQRNMQEQLCMSLIAKALRGDTRAFEVIRDTIGENPKLRLERGTEND